jgi:hypothetical protein
MHVDVPTRGQVEQLLNARAPGCVSIYVPTSPLTQEAEASRIELKNLARDAVGQLEAAALGRDAVEEVRDGLEALVGDDDFWAEQAHSLAVFATPAGMSTFRLPNRLTAEIEVGDRFYVKPLLRAVTFPQAAFVLALAAGAVRLVEVTRDGPAFPVAVPGMPSDAGPIGVGSSDARMLGDAGQKVRLRQYARRVDQALRGVLGGHELPLILAAAEPLASIYRSVSGAPQLVEPAIAGNPEGMSDAELADAARGALDQLYAEQLAAVRERFGQRAAEERASTDVAEVARAATAGAVATLLVDIDEKLPGEVDDAGAVTLSDTDDAASYGVVDELARRVLLHGGQVLAVRREDVPGGGALAAMLRYPL